MSNEQEEEEKEEVEREREIEQETGKRERGKERPVSQHWSTHGGGWSGIPIPILGIILSKATWEMRDLGFTLVFYF